MTDKNILEEAGLARLRGSKQSNAETENAEGVALGKSWALQIADYDELERVAEIEIDDETVTSDLVHAINPDHMDWEVLEVLFDTERPSADMVKGFIEGASTVFNKI